MIFLQCRPIIKNVVSGCGLFTKFSLRSFSCNLNNQRFSLLKLKNLTSTRKFSNWNKFFKYLNVDELKTVDKVPLSSELIYYSGLKKYLLGCQIASVLIFIGGAILVLQQTLTKGPDPKNWIEDPTNFEKQITLYISFSCLILVSVVLSVIVHRMPIRIYNLPQKKQYAFVFFNSIPFKTRTVLCNANDILKLKERGLLPWKNSRYHIKTEQTVIFMENCFRRPADFNIMVGFQKQ